MIAILVVFAPLFALIVWGVVFDVKRRRRHAPLTGHRVLTAWRPRPSGREGNAERSHLVVSQFLPMAIGRLLGVSRYRLQPSPA
jgi:hypothetical protein